MATNESYSITHNLTGLTHGNVTIEISPNEGCTVPESMSQSNIQNGTFISYNVVNDKGALTYSGDDTTSVSCECVVAQENFLTFESDDGSEFTLGTDVGTTGGGYEFGCDGTLEYSTDKTTWQSWTPTNTLTSVNGKLYLRGTGNTYLATYISCFLIGTQITLADRTTKNVEDITYDDELLVWDFDNGEYSSSKPCWITKPGLKNYHYYELTFSDGTILRTTGKNSNHRIYNVDQQKFVAVSETVVGDRVFTESGIVSVVSNNRIEQEIKYVNLITSKTFDCFANGVLTSDRYGNMYDIDSNMKFIKDDRVIRPYSEYENVGISQYWYDNLRLGEQRETVEKSKEYVEKCENQMLAREVE